MSFSKSSFLTHHTPRRRLPCWATSVIVLGFPLLTTADARPDPLWVQDDGAAPPPAGGDKPKPNFDDHPVKPAERVPGHLQGKIENFALVKKIWAVDRSLTQAFIQHTVKTMEFEGELDPKTQSYSFSALPEGLYDLKLELTDGRIIEGCDLRAAADSVDPLTYDDRRKIKTAFGNIRHFADQAVLWKMAGNGEHATAIIELTRTEKTSLDEKVDGDDFVIWRVELWQFTKHGEAWEHDASQVLKRMRPSKKDFETWNIEFAPTLGAVTVAAKEFKFFNLTAPLVSDIHCGRYTREYLHAHREAGPAIHAGYECKVILVDPETGTVVVDIGAGKGVTKGMELWLYAADGKTIMVKGPVLRVSDLQTTAQIPGLKARLPEVDPDDPYDQQGEPRLPAALKDLKIGTSARLVPLPE